MLERFNKLIASRSGVAWRIRLVVWQYAIVREPLRAAVWLVRSAIRQTLAVRQTFSDYHLLAIEMGREIGGRLSLSELNAIWKVRRSGRRALVVGEGLEARQAKLVLEMGGMQVAVVGACQCTTARMILRDRRLKVVVLIGDGLPPETEAGLSRSKRSATFVRVKGAARRALYAENPPVRRARSYPKPSARLAGGEALRVLFLNDVGYQYGAGIALRRQAASFLVRGHEVAVLARTPGNLRGPPRVCGIEAFGGWLGLEALGTPDPRQTWSAGDVLAAVKAMLPDLVIAGNMHSASACIEVIAALKDAGIPTVCYMHDVFWVTGRCAYPMDCSLYRTGCDASCPTAHEAPYLSPELIGAAWAKRAELFAGADPVPLVTNSEWTRQIAVARFGERARSRVVYLGLDHELFSPIDRGEARRIIGIPDDKPIVAMGAVNIADRWKGGPLFLQLQQEIMSRTDLGLVLFGHGSEHLNATKSFGLVDDERFMPLILACADVFVAVPTAEAFGQTLLEAAACGLPVISTRVGGVSELVVHGETGLLVDKPSPEAVMRSINDLVENPEQYKQMGRRARQRVVERFTLDAQGDGWAQCILELF